MEWNSLQAAADKVNALDQNEIFDRDTPRFHFTTRAQKHKTHQPDHLLTVGINERLLKIYSPARPGVWRSTL